MASEPPATKAQIRQMREIPRVLRDESVRTALKDDRAAKLARFRAFSSKALPVLKAMPGAQEKARSLGQEFAHQFGLTADEDQLGWRILLLLAFELWENKLKAPVQTAWHIEQQVVGVLDQAFAWLGGSGSAAAAGASALASGGVAIAQDIQNVENWLTSNW